VKGSDRMYRAHEERQKRIGYAAAAMLVLYAFSLGAMPLPAETLSVKITSVYLSSLEHAIDDSGDPMVALQP
jgi:hypothetical protein